MNRDEVDQALRLEALDAGLNAWHDVWLLKGDHLECRQCAAVHWAGTANEAFLHRPGCPMDHGEVQRPWRDLAVLMLDLPVTD